MSTWTSAPAVSPDTSTTVKAFLLEHAPYLKDIISAPELDADSVDTNPYAKATGGQGVAFLFTNDARKLTLENPMPFYQYPSRSATWRPSSLRGSDRRCDRVLPAVLPDCCGRGIIMPSCYRMVSQGETMETKKGRREHPTALTLRRLHHDYQEHRQQDYQHRNGNPHA